MWPIINEEMALRKLIVVGNNATDLKNSGIVSFKMK